MRNYRQYYDRAREIYRQETGRAPSSDVNALTVTEIRMESSNPYLKLPCEYLELVRSLATRVSDRIERGAGVLHDPHDAGRSFAVKLVEIWDLDELESLAGIVVPQLEETLFGSFCGVGAVHVYRSIPTDLAPRVSWLWHFDNNPPELIKLLIYLTDCDPSTGAFEYLRDPVTSKGLKMPSSRTGFDHWTEPQFKGSRIPESVIETYVADGWERVRVSGPAGTAILFDNNCVHRATTPRHKLRDAVVLLLRPVDRRLRPFISSAHTGSWLHREPVVDPDLLTPIPKNASGPR